MVPGNWQDSINHKIAKLKETFVNDYKRSILQSIDETIISLKSTDTIDNIHDDETIISLKSTDTIDDIDNIDNIHESIEKDIKEIQFDNEFHQYMKFILGMTVEYAKQQVLTNSHSTITEALSHLQNNINTAESGSNNIQMVPQSNIGKKRLQPILKKKGRKTKTKSEHKTKVKKLNTLKSKSNRVIKKPVKLNL